MEEEEEKKPKRRVKQISKSLGWVRCKKCRREWLTRSEHPRCSECGCRTTIPIDKPTEKPTGGMEKHPYEQQLDVETQAKVEFLINAGIGSDLGEITKKLVNNEVLKQIKFGGEKKMANIEVTKKEPEEILDDITVRRALSAEAKRIETEAETDRIRAVTEAKKSEIMPEMERVRERAIRGEPDSMDDMERLIGKMMKMDMISAYIDKIKGNQPGKPTQEVESLKQNLQQLQDQLLEDKRTAEIKGAIEAQRRDNEELRKIFMENIKAKAGDTQGDLITKMGLIFNQRDSDLEKLRLEMGRLDRDSRDKLLDEKLFRIEEKVAHAGSGKDLASIVQDLKTAKEISKEFGGAGTERGKGEMAMDLISSTIDKIKEPILAPVGQAMADTIRSQKAAQQQVIEQQPQFIMGQPIAPEASIKGASMEIINAPQQIVSEDETVIVSEEVPRIRDELINVSEQ